MTEANCIAAGGDYQGDVIPCDPDPCVACPTGAITWTDPPQTDGDMTDARQPRKLSEGTVLQGIDTILATGPTGADASCWSLCETKPEGAANDIAGVADDGAGNYTITLNRRITPGAVTKITYTADDDSKQTATFIFLPADSDANGVSNTGDILKLIDRCLNEVELPAFGDYSCDIDQSGVASSADILRLIDLLNGAGSFASWNLQSAYDGGECP